MIHTFNSIIRREYKQTWYNKLLYKLHLLWSFEYDIPVEVEYEMFCGKDEYGLYNNVDTLVVTSQLNAEQIDLTYAEEKRIEAECERHWYRLAGA